MGIMIHSMRETAIKQRDAKVINIYKDILADGYKGSKEAVILIVSQRLNNINLHVPKDEIKAILKL